jgi:hypothetical protein
MPNLVQNDLQPDLATFRRDGTGSHRSRTISVLFVHHDTEVVESCVQELTKARPLLSFDLNMTGEGRSPDG